jgi:hypothetical protein
MKSIAPAYRAYVRRFVPTMLAYVVLVCGAPVLIRATEAHGALLWLIAAAPALPIAGVFWLIGRLLVELDDEYLRMLEVRKALVATGFAMTVASVWGFLEVYAGAPHAPIFYAPILWFAGLGLGSLVNLIVERA